MNDRTTKLKDLFIAQIENTLQTAKNPDPWLDPKAIFGKLKLLSIDERGRNGQEFFQKVFKLAGYRTAGDNEKTGDWDIKINNYRVEVKTACMDRTGKFQHENVHRTENYDFIFFLDVSPNEIYFSCCPYNQIPWNDIHFRGKSNRPTGAGYKWDIVYHIKNSKLPVANGLVRTVGDIAEIFESCLKK